MSKGTTTLGTTDYVALELHTFGARALRLEPRSGSPNVIGGHADNSVFSSASFDPDGASGCSESAAPPASPPPSSRA